jgi:hypothetical protein
MVNHLKSNWNHNLGEIVQWYGLSGGSTSLTNITTRSGIN